MKLFVVDNHDSFTFNLVQLIEQFGVKDYLIRDNQHLDLNEISLADKILISPGPGLPSEAGDLKEVISRFYLSKSILGICLGHQAIAEVFGAKLQVFDKPFHGYTTKVKLISPHDNLFSGLPAIFNAGLYHSWYVEEKSLPKCLSVTCISEEGIVMGISHLKYNVKGLQFHPESIMTPLGEDIIRNWLSE